MLAAFTLFVLITTTASQSCQYENSVLLTNRSYNGVKYQDREYYVDNITKVERGCVCMKKKCFRKCCPPGQAYNMAEGCVPEPQKFHVPVYYNNNNMEPIKAFNATEKFHFLYGQMECSTAKNETALVVMLSMANLRVMTDGNLHMEIMEVPTGNSNVFIYGPDKYCVDTFVSDHAAKPYFNALICYTSAPERKDYKLSIICMLISCFFILLTVAVYAFLPELRNLHGIVLIAYLLCFFVGFLLLATMQILIVQEQITQDLCIALTLIDYFFLLSAFFWLNVIGYDIWWTFSGIRAPCYTGSPNKRIMYYTIYAYGVPTALTITLGALEFSDLPIQHTLLPNLKLHGCFLYGNSKLLYLYGPMVLLWIANFIFFILTAYNMWKIQKETKMLHGKDSSTHEQNRTATQRFRFYAYVKLFSLMGINWILEVIGSLNPDTNFWRFWDICNMLFGLIIFIIFVCKKKTWEMIKKRYGQVKGDSLSKRQTTTSTTRTHSTSRDEKQMNSVKK